MPELTKEIAEYTATQIFGGCSVDLEDLVSKGGKMITIIPRKSVFMDQVTAYERATGTELKRLSDDIGGVFLRFYTPEEKS